MNFKNRRLYLVLSQENCVHHSIKEVIMRSIKGGVDVIQLREKHLPTPEFIALAEQVMSWIEPFDVPLFINDNVVVARRVNAPGIHVGNADRTPHLIKFEDQYKGMIGYSCESMEHITNESAHLSDYIALSPIYSTPTKENTIIEWGVSGIETVRKMTEKPIVAIGNMKVENVGDVMKAGADCIAVVSAIAGAVDPERAAAALRNEIEKAL